MPKTLHKVQKQIKKKKGRASTGAALHEKSRDAKRLQSAMSRDERIAKLAASKAKANSHQRDNIYPCSFACFRNIDVSYYQYIVSFFLKSIYSTKPSR